MGNPNPRQKSNDARLDQKRFETGSLFRNNKEDTTMIRLTAVLLLLLLAVINANNSGSDKKGVDYFKEGLRLSQDDSKLDAAAMNFWGK